MIQQIIMIKSQSKRALNTKFGGVDHFAGLF